MQKMLIQLDVEKIERENKYNIQEIWNLIDEIFSKGECIKEVQGDGSVMYYGNPKRGNYLADFGLAYLLLQRRDWFVDNAKTWTWYDNDDNESLPFQDTDCLKRVMGFK